MTPLVVTGTAVVGGRVVTASAMARVTGGGITVPVEVDARHLIAFAEIVERHAAAFRRDLDRLMSREREEGERMLWRASKCTRSACAP